MKPAKQLPQGDYSPPFPTPERRGRPQAAPVVPSEVRHAVTHYASSNMLADLTDGELRKALDVVGRHPDATRASFSPARTAWNKLTAEASRRGLSLAP